MVGVQRLVIVGFIQILLGFVAVAHAAQVPLNSPNPNPLENRTLDSALREQQRQIQLEQERLAREQQARDAKNLAAPIQLPETTPDKTDPAEVNAPCQRIDRIELTGATIPSAKQQRSITEGYLNRCLGSQDINALLKAITAWYFQRGYISSRAYLQAQDLTTGTLVVQVVEGLIEGVDATGLPAPGVKQVFPKDGSPLNLRDIEQSLDQINRLRSRQSTMELIPGSEIGGSRIQISTQLKPGDSSSISIDNLGQESTGERQGRINVSFDNPLNHLGFLALSYSRELTQDPADIFSRSASVHYDFPYRYWNVDLDASWFSYSSIVEAFSSSFVSSGVSRSQSLRISKVLHRGQRSKTGARYTLRRADNLSFIQGSRVDTSSRTLVSSSIELWHQYFLNDGVLKNALTWHKGLDWFDGLATPRPVAGNPAEENGALPQLPQAQYSKLSLSTYLSLQLPPKWFFNRVQSQLSAQYARVQLFGPDQISVGSAYSVRGFKGAGLAGNTGAYLRQDLTRVMTVPETNWLSKTLGMTSVELGFGLDGGVVSSLPREAEKYHRLSGVSAGVRMHFGSKGSLSVEYAKPLSYPSYLPVFAGTAPGNDLYLRGSYVL
ncbi:ShlB/FhaC/HecB family hemolysin secretion/activation protein [Pseudomonadales bacterium]|nr:ShlB/FhaC/HecB family hemolysin secretion/activation protein [Pseudomonadales bacterium]